MRWQDKLTARERRHLREVNVLTIKALKRMREHQRERKRDAEKRGIKNPVEPCYECRDIAIKLGLERRPA